MYWYSRYIRRLQNMKTPKELNKQMNFTYSYSLKTKLKAISDWLSSINADPCSVRVGPSNRGTFYVYTWDGKSLVRTKADPSSS